MAFTHRITVAYADERSTVINLTASATGSNAGVDISDTVNAGQTKTYNVAINPALVQSMLLSSDQPMAILTNNSSSPQDIINLKAGYPVIWTLNSFWPVPFKGEVTELILQNAGAITANVQIRVLSSS
jgi:hypothetical protein